MNLKYQTGFGNEFAVALIKTATSIFVVILSLFVQVQSQSPASKSVRDEEYRVYDAVIRHMFRDGVTQFDMNAKVSQIVIRDRTMSKYAWSAQKENWEQVKIRLKSLSDETISGYETVRQSEIDLKPNLVTPPKFVLVGDTQLKKMFSNPNEYDRTTEQWEEFYKIFPNSAGVNTFSRVGFDKSNRNALVYFVNWCGPLCGTGTYLHVEKRENGWVVKQAGGMWIS